MALAEREDPFEWRGKGLRGRHAAMIPHVVPPTSCVSHQGPTNLGTACEAQSFVGRSGRRPRISGSNRPISETIKFQPGLRKEETENDLAFGVECEQVLASL